jgi:hypothetical protein
MREYQAQKLNVTVEKRQPAFDSILAQPTLDETTTTTADTLTSTVEATPTSTTATKNVFSGATKGITCNLQVRWHCCIDGVNRNCSFE